MALGVPLARRNLFGDRRRAVLAVGGIATGLVIVLVMSALFAGFARRETAFVNQLPAEVIVSQAGVRTMQMSVSVLPEGTAAAAAGVPGVAWVEELRQITSTIARPGAATLEPSTDATRLVSYVFGVAPGGRGSPRQLHSGRMPGEGEVVVDLGAARQLGVGIGERVEVFGTPLVVTGLSEGFTSLANTATFLSAEQFASLVGPGTNYLLVGLEPTADAEGVARAMGAALPGTTVQTRATFTAEEAAFLDALYAEVIRIMVLLGYLVAAALVTLTLSALTSAKRREYGIVKALGASRADLAAVVGTQAAWSIGAAFVLALGVTEALAALTGHIAPNIELVIEAPTVALALAGALAVGVPGALLPLRSVARVDPATSFT